MACVREADEITAKLLKLGQAGSAWCSRGRNFHVAKHPVYFARERTRDEHRSTNESLTRDDMRPVCALAAILGLGLLASSAIAQDGEAERSAERGTPQPG